MDYRKDFKAIMHYEPYDKMPIVHFGFWYETICKWEQEGHITADEAAPYHNGTAFDGSDAEHAVAGKLGFDYNYFTTVSPNGGLMPGFEHKVIGTTPDGFELIQNAQGAIEVHRGDAGSIPAHAGHLLTDRKSWDEMFVERLQPSPERLTWAKKLMEHYAEQRKTKSVLVGLHCGSLFGSIRDMMGVEGVSYLYADDEDLFKEIIDTVGELCYRNTVAMLDTDFDFDYAHFWEDICFKNGPLINPAIFREYVGPHYKRITDAVVAKGIDVVSLDCDGWIDKLIPVWLDNGVNTMFPIEVGTWDASIEPWRNEYGKNIRGVGGMNKTVFARDYAAVDAEVERLRKLIDLGGFIPCPDHRIPPDAIWENVQYYCEQMHKIYG